MTLEKALNEIKEHFLNKDSAVAGLIVEREIEFVIIKGSHHPKIVCRKVESKEVMTKVSYDPFNKLFYIRKYLGDVENVVFPFERGMKEVIEYFKQAISDEYDLNYEEINERNRILLKLTDFASLLKEERNKEQERIVDLGPINWISEDELVASDRMDIPIKKVTETYVRLGLLEQRKKYVLMESTKTYMNGDLLDDSKSVFEFQIESVEIILKLLKKILGKDIVLS